MDACVIYHSVRLEIRRCVQERVGRFKEQFSGTRELDGLTSAAAGLPAPVFFAVSAAAAAGAALGGYAVASQAPLEGMGFCCYIYLSRCGRKHLIDRFAKNSHSSNAAEQSCTHLTSGRLVVLVRRNAVEPMIMMGLLIILRSNTLIYHLSRWLPIKCWRCWVHCLIHVF